jgi:hypothetical protein
MKLPIKMVTYRRRDGSTNTVHAVATIPSSASERFGVQVTELDGEGEVILARADLAASEPIVQALFPEWSDIVALSGSSANGEPFFAWDNGWYWLAGALRFADVRYHGGTGPAAASPRECVAALAKTLRIDVAEADAIVTACRLTAESAGAFVSSPLARRTFDHYLRRVLVPRWRAEAGACVMNHREEIGRLETQDEESEF